MPFGCSYYPSVLKCNNGQNIAVVHENSYCLFNILKDYVSSHIERIIWIGFYKNDSNNMCLINKLPKDVILYILYLLGKGQLMLAI